MPSIETTNQNKQLLEQLTEIQATGSVDDVKCFFNTIYPAEISLLLESLPPVDREKIWPLVPVSIMADILIDLNVEVAKGLIKITNKEDLIAAAASLESDDLVDLLHVLPENVVSKILLTIGPELGGLLESALAYPDDTAGGLMSLEVVTIRKNITLDVVWRYLRKRGDMPKATDTLFVVDRDNKLEGTLPVQVLLTKDPRSRVFELMTTNVAAISYYEPVHNVALLFERRDMISAPVVSDSGRLLGRITIDDVVDVIREEADHSLMSMAGLDEEHDMFAPVKVIAKRRSVWLGVNLCTAFLASWVIGLYEVTLEQIVALAVLMPIVASMGGIAGSQTLTLVIRSLALNQIGSSNAVKLMMKELSVGALNGIVWAVIVAIIAGIWFQSAGIGIILGCAMVINLIFAALAGALIPIALQHVGIDPALAGGVLLTTVTDVIGFMAFLGLATIFLL